MARGLFQYPSRNVRRARLQGVAGDDKTKAGSFDYTGTRHRRLGCIGEYTALINRALLSESITRSSAD